MPTDAAGRARQFGCVPKRRVLSVAGAGRAGARRAAAVRGIEGIGGSAMVLGWLLPDAGGQEISEQWSRTAYRPRHGRPPLTVRGLQAAGAAAGRARRRYLGAADEEGLPGVRLAEPAGRPRVDMPNSG